MDLRTFLYLAPCILVSLALHELAHAWVAWRLGDPTAKEEGRVTANPIRHLDPMGTAMFAITSLTAGVPFGWAKPVPVRPGYFKRPREGMALVAAAGPAMNFLLALIAFAVAERASLEGEALTVVQLVYYVNVVLGIFNLIPIPPLDGSRIVGVLMTDETYRQWLRFDQYGMFVVFGMFIVFRNEFSTLLTSAFEEVTKVMSAIVGA